jgi:curli biogenesis system outer membrane secretion channel CsgG
MKKLFVAVALIAFVSVLAVPSTASAQETKKEAKCDKKEAAKCDKEAKKAGCCKKDGEAKKEDAKK